MKEGVPALGICTANLYTHFITTVIDNCTQFFKRQSLVYLCPIHYKLNQLVGGYPAKFFAAKAHMHTIPWPTRSENHFYTYVIS